MTTIGEVARQELLTQLLAERFGVPARRVQQASKWQDHRRSELSAPRCPYNDPAGWRCVLTLHASGDHLGWADDELAQRPRRDMP